VLSKQLEVFMVVDSLPKRTNSHITIQRIIYTRYRYLLYKEIVCALRRGAVDHFMLEFFFRLVSNFSLLVCQMCVCVWSVVWECALLGFFNIGPIRTVFFWRAFSITGCILKKRER